MPTSCKCWVDVRIDGNWLAGGCEQKGLDGRMKDGGWKVYMYPCGAVQYLYL